jgi:hypothetical protein
MTTNERQGGKPEDRRDVDGLVRQCAEMLRSFDPARSVAIEQAIRVRQTINGAEVEVTIALTSEAIEVRLPGGHWNGPAELVRYNRLWKRLSWQDVEVGDSVESVVRALVEEGLAERTQEFFTCRYCGKPFPPEHGDGNACHGCLSKHEGQVY